MDRGGIAYFSKHCGVYGILCQGVSGDNSSGKLYEYDRTQGMVFCCVELCSVVKYVWGGGVRGDNRENCRSIMWLARKQGATRPKQGGGLGNNKDFTDDEKMKKI